MKKANFVVLFTILPLILSGCGLKGPLYRRTEPASKVNLKNESKASNTTKEGSGCKKDAGSVACNKEVSSK